MTGDGIQVKKFPLIRCPITNFSPISFRVLSGYSSSNTLTGPTSNSTCIQFQVLLPSLHATKYTGSTHHPSIPWTIKNWFEFHDLLKLHIWNRRASDLTLLGKTQTSVASCTLGGLVWAKVEKGSMNQTFWLSHTDLKVLQLTTWQDRQCGGRLITSLCLFPLF